MPRDRHTMSDSSTFATREPHYELRFTGLFDRGRGYAFPCDAEGHVDLHGLTDRGRANYLHAQSAVGTEFSAPTIALVT
jgi:hypothetical protein